MMLYLNHIWNKTSSLYLSKERASLRVKVYEKRKRKMIVKQISNMIWLRRRPGF